MDFFVRQRQQGKFISKLFSIPEFGTDNCKVDFLHAADLGITSDFMGSFLSCLFQSLKEFVGSPCCNDVPSCMRIHTAFMRGMAPRTDFPSSCRLAEVSR